jgi:alpha-D-ribose 1-methylphosphonate 5-triphosphate synthase subunit PhnL
MNLLTVDGLSKTFLIHILGGKVIDGFSPISFSVPQGTSLGISGPSGAGKSSVLKCIYGTYIPSAGDIWYESNHFGKVNLARAEVTLISRIRECEIGYITQFLKVLPRVTALDIVAAPLVNDGKPAAEARDTAAALLTRLGIGSHLFDAYPATFSGGEQQRVNIARAVIRAPRLLILDEPTASLDAVTTRAVLAVLEELRAKGTTMIGIFHQQEILAEFSDAIVTLSARMGVAA